MKIARLVAAAAGVLLLAGFTNQGPVLRLPRKILPVPLISQKEDFSCGDVSTLAILRYWNYEKWKGVPEKALYRPLRTTSRKGLDAWRR